MKVEKDKNYNVTFIHWLNKDDIIKETVTGKGYFRFRNFLYDLGYEVNKIEEVNE